MPEPRTCLWCGNDFTPAAPHQLCCSTRCRQARHRFGSAVGRPVASYRGGPLRLAYADPPYPGLSKRYYGDHPDYAGEVDHAALIASLAADYDGWALSTSARALPEILALCPPGVRVAAWHRGERPTRSLGPLNAWEPVIFMGGRPEVLRDASRDPDATRRVAITDEPRRASRNDGPRRGDPRDASHTAAASRRAGTPGRVALSGERDASAVDERRVAPDVQRDASTRSPRRIDSLVWHSRPRRTDPRHVTGAKPAVFCRWLFVDLLNAQPGDEFTDVFPGSGGVGRAWEVFCGGGSV